MKKLIALLLVIVLVFSFAGCSKTTNKGSHQNDNGNYETEQNSSEENEEVAQETHVHSYSNATCTEAAKCSCGATNGSALGHKWKNATCQTPKTCTTCGATNGSALGHKWKNATCQTPKTCTTCGATEGNKAQHSMNGQGVCSACGQDVFLQFVKENVSLNLVVPSVGASNNYYCEVKFVNHTGYNMTLSRFVTANGKMCDNASAQDFLLETDYSIKISFYRATIPEDRWEDRYKDMYLDNNSSATTRIKVNGRQAVIKFGTNGIIDVGNTINEID